LSADLSVLVLPNSVGAHQGLFGTKTNRAARNKLQGP
jgi:hypothetical protein